MRALKAAWGYYLVPGLALAGIRIVSFFTWLIINGGWWSDTPIGSVIGTGFSAILGFATTLIAWPFLVYAVIVGALDWKEALFFPWFSPAFAGT